MLGVVYLVDPKGFALEGAELWDDCRRAPRTTCRTPPSPATGPSSTRFTRCMLGGTFERTLFPGGPASCGCIGGCIGVSCGRSADGEPGPEGGPLRRAGGMLGGDCGPGPTGRMPPGGGGAPNPPGRTPPGGLCMPGGPCMPGRACMPGGGLCMPGPIGRKPPGDVGEPGPMGRYPGGGAWGPGPPAKLLPGGGGRTPPGPGPAPNRCWRTAADSALPEPPLPAAEYGGRGGTLNGFVGACCGGGDVVP